jgi:zinc protease
MSKLTVKSILAATIFSQGNNFASAQTKIGKQPFFEGSFIKLHSAAILFVFWSLIITFNSTIFGQISVSPSTNQSNKPIRVTSIEGITEYRLENGLQVLLFPDQTKQNTTVNIIYKVGSRHEGYGETGMAHLLEHLLFKGTPKNSKIPADLTARGASFNANTWYDRTSYFQTFAASNENLDWVLEMEADRMINSFIAKKDLDSEFSVVRNEMESRENSPSNILSEKVMATAYQWHNYGKTTIGARSDVENVKIENLQAFYRKYYQPDNATLIVAGKFDEAKTLDSIQKKFGVIAKPTRVLEPTWTVEPVQDGERQVTLRRVGDTQWVMAGYHIPPTSHPDFPAVIVMNAVLADAPSGRLYKSLVESKKATGVFSQTIQNKEPSYSIFAAQLGKTSAIEDVRQTMLQDIENFAATPPSKEEVERFKLQSLKAIETSFIEPNTVALALTEWVGRGDWRLIFLYRDRMKKVTPEDVQRAAQKYLLQSNRTLGMFIPTEKPVRAEVPRLNDKEILAMANEVKGGETVATGEVFEPTPANIESRTKFGQIGGLKTVFLSKENRGDAVTFGLTLRFGDEKSLMNRRQISILTSQMLMRGTTKRTRQQIKDDFIRLNAQVFNPLGISTAVTFYVTTTRQNLPEVIKLVAELVQDPSFQQAEFDQLKASTLTNLENGRSEPTPIALRAANIAFNKYPKGDVRYNGTLDEEIADVKAITPEDLKNFHRDFYGASAGELGIVGDFDEKEIAPLLTQLFGNWKSKNAYQRIPSEYFDIPAFNKNIETPDKANAFFYARLNLKMRQDNPDYAAFVIGNFILGGGSLNSRLGNRIRQNEGLSYSVSSSFGAGFFDENGTFVAQAIYAPQNVEKLEAAFKEELQKVIKEGFTADEVAQAKQGWLLNRQRDRGQDLGLVANLNNLLFVGKTFTWEDELDKKVQSLTPEQINAAMKKYLTPDKISIVKAGDFAKAKAAKP